MDRRKKLGAKIVYFRKLKAFTQKDFAEQVGVSRQYLSRLEHGQCECNLEMIYCMASALNIEPEELIKDL